MAAALHDLALLHDDDLISISDCAQSVRHDHDCLLAAADQFVERLLHLVLTLRVQRRSCLVE